MARFLTKQNARAIGSLGGRPKGVLNKSTITKTQTKQALEAVLQKQAGLVADNLLKASCLLDTRASEIILDRAFGKVPQGVQMQVATFSLKELAEYRKSLQEPADKTIVSPQLDASQDIGQGV